MQVPKNHIEIIHVKGENVQIFRGFQVSMGNYMLHSSFHARDMDNMDLVLGYPWMQLVDAININVENKFSKLRYKKKKVILKDISLTTQQDPKGVHDVVFTRRLKVIHIDTFDEESMVIDTIDDILAHEDIMQDMHHTTKEDPPNPHVIVVKIASYYHPHHPVRQ